MDLDNITWAEIGIGMAFVGIMVIITIDAVIKFFN